MNLDAEQRKLLRRFLRRSLAFDGAIAAGWLVVVAGSRNEALVWQLEQRGLVRRSGPDWVLTFAGLAEAISSDDKVAGIYLRDLAAAEREAAK